MLENMIITCLQWLQAFCVQNHQLQSIQTFHCSRCLLGQLVPPWRDLSTSIGLTTPTHACCLRTYVRTDLRKSSAAITQLAMLITMLVCRTNIRLYSYFQPQRPWKYKQLFLRPVHFVFLPARQRSRSTGKGRQRFGFAHTLQRHIIQSNSVIRAKRVKNICVYENLKCLKQN